MNLGDASGSFRLVEQEGQDPVLFVQPGVLGARDVALLGALLGRAQGRIPPAPQRQA